MYPVSFIDKPHLENGDKVIMPPSALDRLASLRIDYPMLFRVENMREGRSSHCGVLEFVAEEGVVYFPYWMMQNLLLSEGDLVKMRSATLPKGTYVKLQPQTKDFLDISNPKAVLETTLRNFTCLTVGDTILINYNSKGYHIDIVEARPQEGISIVETDCEVDFAPPLDYVEPERPAPPPAAASPSVAKPADKEEPEPEPEDTTPKFLAFAGSGNRLDGKAGGPSAPIAVPVRTSALNGTTASAMFGPPTDPAKEPSPGSGSAPRRVQGKLVFGQARAGGSGSGAPPPPKKPEPKPAEPAETTTGFKAFSGKGNSLR